MTDAVKDWLVAKMELEGVERDRSGVEERRSQVLQRLNTAELKLGELIEGQNQRLLFIVDTKVVTVEATAHKSCPTITVEKATWIT